MMVRLALAPWTARFTLAIGLSLSVSVCRSFEFRSRSDAEHAADAAAVALGDFALAAEAALGARGLLLQDVVQLGVAADQLAALGHAETAGGATVGLHLGHVGVLPRFGLVLLGGGAAGLLAGAGWFRLRWPRWRAPARCCQGRGRPAPEGDPASGVRPGATGRPWGCRRRGSCGARTPRSCCGRPGGRGCRPGRSPRCRWRAAPGAAARARCGPSPGRGT